LNPEVIMICLITGSSRGLGRSIALALGKKGHRIALHYKERKKEAENTASQIKDAIVLGADVSNSLEVDALIKKIIHIWGRIDLLVNNAGITKEALLLKTTEKDFQLLMDTNLKGPFNVIRGAARYMMKNKNGHIINISSIAGVKGKEGLSVYAASKAGLIGLTMTAASEMSRYNIMVNAVLPGFMLTDMGAASGNKAKSTALKDSLAGDFSDPGRVAGFICFLAESKGITGQVFNLDSRPL
jgi:3-oxoacyl-[acyl-carrier protein] reductase